MSIQMYDYFLVEKQDIGQYIKDHKQEIEEKAKTISFRPTEAMWDAAFSINDDSTEEEIKDAIYKFKKAMIEHKYEIRIGLLDVGLDDHVIIWDAYKMLTGIHVGCLDVHTGGDGWDEDYDEIIKKNKVMVDGKKPTAHELLDLLDDETSNGLPLEYILATTSSVYSFVDYFVMQIMRNNTVKEHIPKFWEIMKDKAF